MQEIPDIGGGFAGFIARLLWHVYQYFPFEGTLDWVLLFILLAVLTRVGAMPLSRKLAKRWAYKLYYGNSKLTYGDPRIWTPVLHNLCTQTGPMFLFVWFFSTEEGHTFLVGRSVSAAPLLEAKPNMVLLSALLFLFPAFSLSLFALDIPLFLTEEDPIVWALISCSAIHTSIVLGALVIYWYWSLASLILMWVFSFVDWVLLIRMFFWPAPPREHGKT
jgi:hypothetical protein